jgi:hypothetical protein
MLTYDDFKKEVSTLNLQGVFEVDDYYEEDVDETYSIYSFKDFENSLLIQYYTDSQEWTYGVNFVVGYGVTLEDAIVDFNNVKS